MVKIGSVTAEILWTLSFSFLACLEVAMLDMLARFTRLARLARLVRLVRLVSLVRLG